jgi:hypothetical protein
MGSSFSVPWPYMTVTDKADALTDRYLVRLEIVVDIQLLVPENICQDISFIVYRYPSCELEFVRGEEAGDKLRQ